MFDFRGMLRKHFKLTVKNWHCYTSSTMEIIALSMSNFLQTALILNIVITLNWENNIQKVKHYSPD